MLQWRAQTTPDHVLYTLLNCRVRSSDRYSDRLPYGKWHTGISAAPAHAMAERDLSVSFPINTQLLYLMFTEAERKRE